MSDHPLSIRPVQGYEGRYEVDSNGNIYSIISGKKKLLKPVDTNGYNYVPLWKDSKFHFCSVHRIVAKAFLPIQPDKDQVNHKDRDKKNNNVTNLEWCTRQENMEHAFSKEYTVVDPSGKKISIYNLEKFCRDNELDASNLKKVISGKRKIHKGYTAFNN